MRVNILFLLAFFLPIKLLAQDVQALNPLNGRLNLVATESPEIEPPKTISYGLLTNFAKNPAVELNPETGKTQTVLIENLTTLHFLMNYAVNTRLELMVDTPYGFSAGQKKAKILKNQKQNTLDDASALNNIKFSPKVKLLGSESLKGFSLSLALPQSIPFKHQGGEMTTSYFASGVRLAASYKLKDFRFLVNVGYRYRFGKKESSKRKTGCEGSTTGICYNPFFMGDAITWSVGSDWQINETFKLMLEVYGKSFFAEQANPIEALAGLRITASESSLINLGIGRGVTGALSTPDFRFVMGISIQPTPPKDSDSDGVEDSKDHCQAEPEDFDRFEDLDGCPDHDNDRDGILDSQDKCPLEPEDKDDFEDSDGCIDRDNDKDGLPDLRDSCPNHAEDFDQYLDSDGCPDDNDLGADAGINKGNIVTQSKIYFEKDSSNIVFPQSSEAIHFLALFLKRNPKIEELHIESYVDDSLSPELSKTITQARSEEIKKQLLLRLGNVKHLELKAFGFGSERPFITSQDLQLKKQNLRAIFRIKKYNL